MMARGAVGYGAVLYNFSPPVGRVAFGLQSSHVAAVNAPPLVAMAETFTPNNVMITGGAGFIASHVAILFAKKYPNYKARSFIHNYATGLWITSRVTP